MKIMPKQTQLYRFLDFCNKSDLEKVVLDCGAGGNCPPISLFSEFGYKTYGIEISHSQIEKSNKFSQENGLKLNIMEGDIRKLPFHDESISYIYSYNSIFHMKKVDIEIAINEIKRVLKPEGLACINFLSVYDGWYGKGEKLSKYEYFQLERGEKVIHSYYDSDEADSYFKDMEILFKENRILDSIFEGEKIRQGYIDYIVKK